MMSSRACVFWKNTLNHSSLWSLSARCVGTEEASQCEIGARNRRVHSSVLLIFSGLCKDAIRNMFTWLRRIPHEIHDVAEGLLGTHTTA